MSVSARSLKFRNEIKSAAAEQDKNAKQSVRERIDKHISAAAEQNATQSLDEIEAKLKELKPQLEKVEKLISSGSIDGRLLERAQDAINTARNNEKKHHALQMAINSRRTPSNGGRRKSRRRRQSNNKTRKYK